MILDELGWIKISMNRFFWDYNNTKPTDAQKSTIFDYMSGKKMEKALFNSMSRQNEQMLSEALKEFNEE
jgi:hypothetical protein